MAEKMPGKLIEQVRSGGGQEEAPKDNLKTKEDVKKSDAKGGDK